MNSQKKNLIGFWENQVDFFKRFWVRRYNGPFNISQVPMDFINLLLSPQIPATNLEKIVHTKIFGFFVNYRHM